MIKALKNIQVTADIIKLSTRGDENRCMVAEAIHQQFPTASHIYVDKERIAFTKGNTRYWFLPPPNVQNFIIDFDLGHTITPFEFSTNKLMKHTHGGKGAFLKLHEKGDNRTNPRKQYDPKKKKNRYAKRIRVAGECRLVPLDSTEPQRKGVRVKTTQL